MMKRCCWLFVLVFGLYAPSAFCDDLTAGDLLKQYLQPREKVGAERYIVGAAEMMLVLETLWQKNTICPPAEKLSSDQMVRMVIKWIEKNPEKMHKPALGAVFSTFTEAFPCKKQSEAAKPPATK